MNIIRYSESGEFWGAKYTEQKIELNIEKSEILEIIYKKLDNGLDYIPSEIDIECENITFKIELDDYLEKEDFVNLETYLKGLQDD